MDAKDLLESFRQNYFLGNYGKLLEKWNQTEDTAFGDHLNAINLLVARAIICSKSLQPKNPINFTKQPSQVLIGLKETVSKYLTTLEPSGQKDEATYRQMSGVFKEILHQNQNSPLYLLIGSYIALAGNDLNFFTLNENLFRENYELLYIYILALLRNGKIEIAEAKLTELKRLNDEDVLTLLATIHILMSQEKYIEAVKYIDEVKERYGDSTRMINMKISCYMLQQRWNDALSLAEKLFTAMSQKAELFDIKELEVCISNLIILGEICDKVNPDHYKMLFQVNENSPFIKRFTELKASFTEMSNKLSVK